MSAQRFLFSTICRNFNRQRLIHHPTTLDASRDRDEERHGIENHWEIDILRTHHNLAKPLFIDQNLNLSTLLNAVPGVYSPNPSQLPLFLKDDIIPSYEQELSVQNEENVKYEDVNRSFSTRVAHMENNMGVKLAIAKKLQESTIHFTKAAEQQNIDAKYNLALCKFTDNDTKTQAIDLWDAASKESHPSATYQLAVCYLRGNGIKKDKTRGLELMHKAASLNSPDAIFYLIVKSIKEGDMKQVTNYTRKVKNIIAVREKLHQIMEKNGFPMKAKQAITSVLDT